MKKLLPTLAMLGRGFFCDLNILGKLNPNPKLSLKMQKYMQGSLRLHSHAVSRLPIMVLQRATRWVVLFFYRHWWWISKYINLHGKKKKNCKISRPVALNKYVTNPSTAHNLHAHKGFVTFMRQWCSYQMHHYCPAWAQQNTDQR